MGYISGSLVLDHPLLDSQALYLLDFGRTRRVKRDVAKLQTIPDPGRAAVDLPLGEEGGYFINEHHAQVEATILDHNRPPVGQPALYCQWVPTANGYGIAWDGRERFYRYVEWLQYLLNHFLGHWGQCLSGTVRWQGETPSDCGQIVVAANQIVQPMKAEELLRTATTPIAVPLDVWQGLEVVNRRDGTALSSWVATIEQAHSLGYEATASWIEANLTGKYGAGVDRGFAAIGTGAVFMPRCPPIGTWVN